MQHNWKSSCLYSAQWLHLMRRKLKVVTWLYLIFIFHREPSKAHLHSHSHCASLSLPLFAVLSISLSHSLLWLALHVIPSGGLQSGGRWPLSPASLLRFRCSCWAAIKTVKKRRFHANYDTIKKHLVKRRSKNEGQTLISVKWIRSIWKHL